jgi:hypothetical protein
MSSVSSRALRHPFETRSDPVVSAQCRSNRGIVRFLGAVFHLFDFTFISFSLPPPLIDHGLQGCNRHSIHWSWPKTIRNVRTFDCFRAHLRESISVDCGRSVMHSYSESYFPEAGEHAFAGNNSMTAFNLSFLE